MSLTTEQHIAQLVPGMQPLVHAFLKKAAERGYRLVINSSYRSLEAQAQLYANGRGSFMYNGKVYRAEKNVIVTNAKPGTSQHNYRRAIDVYDLRTVNPATNAIDYNATNWGELASLAESAGLTAGFRWKIRDSSHYEYLGPAEVLASVPAKPEEKEVPLTNEEIYKNIFIAWYTRWPTDEEMGKYRELAAQGLQPYTVAQKLFIEPAQEELNQLRQSSGSDQYALVTTPLYKKINKEG